MTTYDEASAMPFTDVLNRYQVLENRGTMSRATTTLRARGEWNDDRSLDPDDYPPLTAARAPGDARSRRGDRPPLPPPIAGASYGDRGRDLGADRGRHRRRPGPGTAGLPEVAEGQHQPRQDFPDGIIGLGDDEYAAGIKAAGAADPEQDLR